MVSLLYHWQTSWRTNTPQAATGIFPSKISLEINLEWTTKNLLQFSGDGKALAEILHRDQCR